MADFKTPAHIFMPLLRHLFTFHLMRITLTAVVSVGIKVAAEELLIGRLEGLMLGERFSLARRASGRVLNALLLNTEPSVICAALNNAELIESAIVKALLRAEAPEA